MLLTVVWCAVCCADRVAQILRCGPFEAARSILGGGKTPLRDRYEAFFTDYSLLPLLVQQNYLSSLMTVDAKTRVEVTAGAAAAMSDMDIVGGKIRLVFRLPTARFRDPLREQ